MHNSLCYLGEARYLVCDGIQLEVIPEKMEQSLDVGFHLVYHHGHFDFLELMTLWNHRIASSRIFKSLLFPSDTNFL